MHGQNREWCGEEDDDKTRMGPATVIPNPVTFLEGKRTRERGKIRTRSPTPSRKSDFAVGRTEEVKRREPILRAELIDPFSRAETPMNRTPTNDLEAARPSVLDSRLRGTPTSTRGPCAAMSCRPAKEGVTNRERRINFSDRKFYTHSLPFLREFDRDYTLCSIHSVMIFCKVCLKCCTG